MAHASSSSSTTTMMTMTNPAETTTTTTSDDDDVAMAMSDGGVSTASSSSTPSSSSSSSNPLVQLATYVKDTAINFKDGLVELNVSHRKCNAIREKQRNYARSVLGTSRPRGIRGMQVGGINYEEYDFLRKGLVDRNKLFAVIMVSLCLPNYFVYYLWSFPDMMPGPFVKNQRNANEISRMRCHAVVSTILDLEKGARVAPWSSKLNPFGRGATERAMSRLGDMIESGCSILAESDARGPSGMGTALRRLGGVEPSSSSSNLYYSSSPITKQQRLLAGNKNNSMTLPRQIMKGLTRAINADPINKGAAPFGIGAVQHIESLALVDEFIVNHGIDVMSDNDVNSNLIEEACSARLIGCPNWTDVERRGALASWLREVEIAPREEMASSMMTTTDEEGGEGMGEDNDDDNDNVGQQRQPKRQPLYYNGNMARAVLMCYNAVDGTRDARSDSRLLRAMYQGRKE
ncbi:hypothetical protein ACHAXA_010854 [Cyclostephanos tholiformis]|uniref:Uncharacterized protein n=1 Tax=Cyclostephanos tholiformis TaxID=382380 RepID=A0ABD3SD72_9STRA